LTAEYLDENIGKARAANDFIAKYIDKTNLPKTVWSMDPDILFDMTSFDYLLEAVQNLDGVGVLGMRYKNNECNPELNLWLPPRNLKGGNGKAYSVVFPVLCCVAGPVLAMKGEILSGPLKFKLFPKKYVRVYGGDDSAIHYELKKRGYKNGYLNGTLATHLKSGDLLAKEIRNFKE
jgi:GT2 family glycosyltransferase